MADKENSKDSKKKSHNDKIDKKSKKNEQEDIPKALKKEGTDGKKNNKVESDKPKKKKRKWVKVILIIILLLILAAGAVFAYKSYKNGGGLGGMLATAMGHNEDTKKNLSKFNVLLLGVSTDLDSELTDTIMVASYDPKEQTATLLSIPRDTFIGKSEAKATGADKINAVYSLKGGAESTLEEVNKITGLDINYYIVVKTEALIKLVDAIGGVQFNVPIDMKYDDKTQDLHINLQAGEQLIDGTKAEQLLRFRHNNDGTTYPTEYGDNDIGRMRTQREFLAEVMRQTLKVENLLKLGEILDIAKENVITNIDFSLAKDYLPYAVEFNTENLITDSLPGIPKMCNQLWFFVYDKTQTRELVTKLFGEDAIVSTTTNTTNSSKTNSSKNNTTTNSTKNSTTNSIVSSTGTSKETATIEVLDGTGGTAKFEEAVTKLKTAGFNVKKTGKANKTSRTVITNKKYAADSVLEEIKTTLGVGGILNSAASTSTVDISIVIGTDYK